MDPLVATQAIAVVIPAHYAGAGIALFAAAVAIVGYRQALHRSFIVCCICVAGMQFAQIGYYQAKNVADAVQALHWQGSFILALIPFFFAFVALYTGQRSIPRWFIAIAAACTVLLVAHLMAPFGLRFSTLELAPPIIMPWGEKLSGFKVSMSMWNVSLRILIMVVTFWAVWRARVQYLRGERRSALLLVCYLGLHLAAFMHGALIDLGVVRSIYTAAFAFAAVPLLMGFSLVMDLDERSRTQARMLHELEESNQSLLSAKRDIAMLAHFDPVTKLPNRAHFREHAGKALRATGEPGLGGALLLLDLDHFRTINDGLGHHVGDEVLREVATRLQSVVGEECILANLGGDGFVVLCENRGSDANGVRAAAIHLANQMMAALQAPMQVGEHRLQVVASIGIASFPQAGAGPFDIFRQAEIALYRAKDQGRHTTKFYQSSMRIAVEQRLAMDRHLRGALERREFSLHFQPQVDANRCITGVEALLRWRNPELGMVSPVLFIPLAEETGLIRPIGNWVLEATCDQLAAWIHEGVEFGDHLAVNISPWQLSDPLFVEGLEKLLSSRSLDPRRLMIELTESSLLFDLEGCITKLTQLRAMGIKIALDDFGTGYSSLSYLNDLPLDILKIDKSFVRTLRSGERQPLASGIVAIGNHMGMTVVAEGVETENQREVLLEMGCEFHQGYLYSKPLEESAFRRWLIEGGSLSRAEAANENNPDQSSGFASPEISANLPEKFQRA